MAKQYQEGPKCKIQTFWTFHEELTIEDGLVIKGTRILSYQAGNKMTILKLIHEGHLGLNKCKLTEQKKQFTGQV